MQLEAPVIEILDGSRVGSNADASGNSGSINIVANDSLVLLDAIGRGTTTFDGISVAWAVAEHIHDWISCRAMFATHYHELTDLAKGGERIVNVSVAVKEHQDRVVFLRRLTEGPANRSYGLQVAKLAGIPAPVLEAAREKLAELESGAIVPPAPLPAAGPAQDDLFSSAVPHPVLTQLEQLQVDELSPRQALELLYQLKSRLD